MSKEPDILPEDYDDWERDYYDRRSSGGLVGCAFFSVLLIISLGYFMYSLIF